MEGRMAYQVRPPELVARGGSAGSPTVPPNAKELMATLLEDAQDDPLQAAYMLEVLKANPELATDVDLSEVQSQLETQLEQARARLDQRPEDAPVNLDLVNDLAILTVVSAVLDQEEHALDYERGVIGLLDVLETTGRFGDLRGGAMRSLNINHALVQAAYIAALHGDDRLRDHAYFAFAPYWMMHRFQPNGEPFLTHQIAPDDASAVKARTYGELIALASLYPSPEIKWWFENFGDEEIGSGFALTREYLNETELPEDFEPPPYGLYPHAGVLFWRSNWQPNADALLARGAVENDPNAKLDAGHITWIGHGEPVLTKASEEAQLTPVDNRNGEADAEKRLIPAHNVLRVGDAQPVSGRAPIVTRELNANGGNLRIDSSALYPELSQWHRDLFWEAEGELRIIDTINYDFGQRERTTLFWHLNAKEPVKLETDRSRTIIEWEDSAIVVQGNSPIEIQQFMVPDAPGSEEKHVVLALRTIGRPPSLRVLTRVLPRESSNQAIPKASSPDTDMASDQ